MLHGLLAYNIDNELVHWVLAAIVSAIGAAAPFVIMAWRKFIGWIGPMIQAWFSGQTNLVNTLNEQAPMMASTLKKLGETQDRQCQTLDTHTLRLDGHDQHLREILGLVREKKTSGDHPAMT